MGGKIPLSVETVGLVSLVKHELPSQGLVYIDVRLSLADLSLGDVSYVPLIAYMMVEAGTSELPPDVLGPLIGRITGRTKAEALFKTPLITFDPYGARGIFFVYGKVSWLEVRFLPKTHVSHGASAC